MTAEKQREIVVEFEKVQMIRKRAKTKLRHCDRCNGFTDVVLHTEAAELFETTPGKLFQFIEQNDCHYHVNYLGKIYLCVASLLEHMNRQKNIRLALANGE